MPHHLGMGAVKIALAVAIAIGSFGGGWLARDATSKSKCAYTARGYPPLKSRLDQLQKLALEEVVDTKIIGDIQKCWAAHPFVSPQDSLLLKDARKADADSYYVIFEPWGVTDVEVAFLVENGSVAHAFHVSTR